MIIHQIAISDRTIKEYTSPNFYSIQKHFKDFEYILWDYKKIKAFLLKNKDKHILDAIENISANAFKADIFRYYIVNKFGGLYVDLNIFFERSFKINPETFLFFKDMQDETKTSWAVSCGLFYSERGSSILSDAVNQCVENVNKEYYGGHALCPTGPNLFGSVIARNNLQEDSNYTIGSFEKTADSSVFLLNNKVIAKYKSNNLPYAESGLFGGNNYAKLWNSKSLYA